MSHCAKKRRYKYRGIVLPPMYLIINTLQKRFLFHRAPNFSDFFEYIYQIFNELRRTFDFFCTTKLIFTDIIQMHVDNIYESKK